MAQDPGQRDNVISEAREKGASQQAEKLYRDAMAALQQDDVDTAKKGHASLQALYDLVLQEYQLRIVSRPGTPSGVWRYPKNNPGARNYYLIVNAVTPDGQTLTLPITSEEDGNLVIRDLLVKDYPIILRLSSTEYVFLPIVLKGHPR